MSGRFLSTSDHDKLTILLLLSLPLFLEKEKRGEMKQTAMEDSWESVLSTSSNLDVFLNYKNMSEA